MKKSIKDNLKKRGRPATGNAPLVGVRMTEEFQAEIVAWARMQPDVPALATAIRRLVKIGLEANVTKRSVSKPGQKARAQELAAKTIDGTVPSSRALLRMSDDEIIARLTQVRGIGRWTVEMLLLFDLGRPDVWPVDDYGVRKGFAKTFGRRKLPTPKQLRKLGEKWRPYRSVAAWYFWRALDAPEKKNRSD